MKTDNRIFQTVTLFKTIWDGAVELDGGDENEVSVSAFELFANVAGDLLKDKHFGLFVIDEYQGTPTKYVVSIFDTAAECQEFINATGKYDISDLADEERKKLMKSRSEISFDDFVKLNPLSWNNLGSYSPDQYFNVVDFTPINEG